MLKLKAQPRPTKDETFLPSGGYPYGDLLPDGRIIVSAFSWATEQLLFQGPQGKGKKQYSRYLDAIKQVADLPPDLSPKDLLGADMMYILLKARSLSYGESFTFASTCPSCGNKETVTVKIPEGMPHNRYPYDFREDPYIDYETTVGNEIRIGFLRIKDELECETTIRSKVTSKQIPQDQFDSELARYQLAAHVKFVNGEKVTSIEDVVNWLDKSLQEKEEISSILQELAPGVSYSIPMVCEVAECAHEYNAWMPIGSDFFRPRKRVNTKKLPAGVRIGVFGEDARCEVSPGSGTSDVSGDSGSVRGRKAEGTRKEDAGSKGEKQEKVEGKERESRK